MFTLAIDPTYPHRVTGTLPGGTAFDFEAHFRRLSPAQVDAIARRAQARELQDVDLAREVLAGWSEVCNPPGVPAPFSPESLESALAIFGFAPAVVRGWYESLGGAREKN